MATRVRATGRSVLALDLPGHGTRAGETDPGAFTLDATVDAIDAALEGVGPASLAGYSMGGRLALHYAIRRPGRVDRLILESASPGLQTAGERAARREADAALAASLEREGIRAFVERWEALELFASQRALPEPTLVDLRRRRLANVPESLAASLRGVGTGALPSLWDRLEDVRMPVLIVVGALDEKFLGIGRRMAERLPRARLHVAEGAGHRVHLERPDTWVDAVTGFLGA